MALLRSRMEMTMREMAAKSRMEERRKARLLLARHDGASVTGLAVDALNKTVISVGADAKLILWSFGTAGSSS